MLSPQTGRLTTLAGTGSSGPLGDGGPAASAFVQTCQGSVRFGGGEVAVDHTGDLVVADAGGDGIRVVARRSGTFYGQPMTAGDIYTVAGTGTAGFSGDGGPAGDAQLNSPDGVAVDAAGNLLIADTGNNRVRVVAASSGTFYGQPMTAGDIYTVAGTGTAGFSGDGGPTTAAGLHDPATVTVDRSFNLVITDSANSRIRVVARRSGTFYEQPMTAGDIYTVAGTGTAGFSGDGGPAADAELNAPGSVAVDGAGNLLIADTGDNRVRVVAASTGTFYGQPMTTGDIYTIAGTGMFGFSSDGGPATSASVSPEGVAVDGAGNVLIADPYHYRVRVVAEGTGTFYGQPMTAGDIYTIAGDGSQGFAGDGGPASAAEMRLPSGVRTGGPGNLLIADTYNHKIRVVAGRTATFYGQPMKAGDIYTVAGDGIRGFAGNGGPATAAELNRPDSTAVDAAGNLLIADTGNNRIRLVAHRTGTFYGQFMRTGHIYTIAGGGPSLGDGGPAAAAELSAPGCVAVDRAGNVLIADTGNDRIRVVAASTGTFYGQQMTAGDIYTVAGTGTTGFSGDGGPATSAELDNPQDAAIDAAGNVLIADTGNDRIRVAAASTGTFYGQQMTTGDIYTVAGTGTRGFTGDGGPATSAELGGPAAVAVDAAGNLLITDSGNNRIREITG